MALKDKLKKTSYNRGFVAGRSISVLMLGESRWLSDIELLLEDRWPNLVLVTEETEVSAALQKRSPKIAVLEKGLWGDSELRLIESVLPTQVKRIVVTPEVKDEIGWRKLLKRLCQLNASGAVLDTPADQAAQEIESLLDGLVNSGSIDMGEAFTVIKCAFEGFRLSSQTSLEGLMSVYKLLLSQFALEYDVLSAALLLGKSYAMWKTPRDASNEISTAYSELESLVKDNEAGMVFSLLATLDRHLASGATLSNEEWEKLVNEAGAGKIAARKLIGLFDAIVPLLASVTPTKLLRVA